MTQEQVEHVVRSTRPNFQAPGLMRKERSESISETVLARRLPLSTVKLPSVAGQLPRQVPNPSAQDRLGSNTLSLRSQPAQAGWILKASHFRQFSEAPRP